MKSSTGTDQWETQRCLLGLRLGSGGLARSHGSFRAPWGRDEGRPLSSIHHWTNERSGSSEQSLFMFGYFFWINQVAMVFSYSGGSKVQTVTGRFSDSTKLGIFFMTTKKVIKKISYNLSIANKMLLIKLYIRPFYVFALYPWLPLLGQ